MPSVRKRRLPPTTAFVILACIHDPERRRGNIRVIVEGPFGSRQAAVAVLKTLLSPKRFSVADTQVLEVSRPGLFYRQIDRIREAARDAQRT